MRNKNNFILLRIDILIMKKKSVKKCLQISEDIHKTYQGQDARD